MDITFPTNHEIIIGQVRVLLAHEGLRTISKQNTSAHQIQKRAKSSMLYGINIFIILISHFKLKINQILSEYFIAATEIVRSSVTSV